MKKYYISYWDKAMKDKSTFIKAKNQNEAEDKFYKKEPYSLIKKISLN